MPFGISSTHKSAGNRWFWSKVGLRETKFNFLVVFLTLLEELSHREEIRRSGMRIHLACVTLMLVCHADGDIKIGYLAISSAAADVGLHGAVALAVDDINRSPKLLQSHNLTYLPFYVPDVNASFETMTLIL